MKKFISVILTILLLILGIDFICSAASDLSSMSNCRFIFAESNKSGSYLYGYNGKNIYSAKVLPKCRLYEVSCLYNVCSVVQCDNLTCAISRSKGNSINVTIINDNGTYNSYTFNNFKNIDYSSFAVCGNKIYFISNTQNFDGIKTYYLNGDFIDEYSLDENISKMFCNNSKVYAMTRNGNIYNITSGSKKFICDINSTDEIQNIGTDLLYCTSGKIINLQNHLVKSAVADKLNLTAVSGDNVITAYGNKIKYKDRYYSAQLDSKYLLKHGNILATVNSAFDYRYIDIKNLSSNNSKSYFDNSSNNSSDNNNNISISGTKNNFNEYIMGNDLILYNVSPITVSKFKNNFSQSVTVYNTDNEIVTSGKVKSGYSVKIDGVKYKIAVKGDVTGEGNVKSNDIDMIMKYIVGSKTLDNPYKQAADYNLDGNVDTLDLVMISKSIE